MKKRIKSTSGKTDIRLQRTKLILAASEEVGLDYKLAKKLIDDYESHIRCLMMENKTVWLEGIGTLINYEDLTIKDGKWGEYTKEKRKYFLNLKNSRVTPGGIDLLVEKNFPDKKHNQTTNE